MSKYLIVGGLAAMLAGPVFAQSEGDAAAGEEAFSQCQTCHVVEDDEGNVLAGRNGKQGPNLYNVVGRQAGSLEGFRYRPDIVAAGEAGLVWSEEELVGYLQDPNAFLTDKLGERARSGMAYRVRTEEEAANLAAFLHSMSPAAEEEGS